MKKIEKLYKQAKATMENAYAPYSNHPVGSALTTTAGKVFTGCNVETANYKGTCAEAGAIASMIAAGEKEIKEIAIVGPGDHLCSPCGDCRQRIREFSDPENTLVHVFTHSGKLLKTYTVEQLLPDSFGPENLNL